MSLKIDYKYTEGYGQSKDLELSVLDEVNLRYSLLLGKISFLGKEIHLDLTYDWIPLYDFAKCMKHVSEELEKVDKAEFEFTESESKLLFEKDEENVRIVFDLTGEIMIISLKEFRNGVNDFIARFSDDLENQFPYPETKFFINKNFS